ncbi:hypothetical protein GCM10010420_14030 [Streptomyces glaucosporus]|uniref:Uncharacterized protein n=1 Tax=Streptomyces glaucosporus TaxID=284044 RepID=A0ABN3I029_9ACTN
MLTALATTVLVLLASTGCARWAEPPPLPPAGVYEHGAADENSRAEPVPPDGVAGALTRPLRKAGWFCAQVRANADGRALWCRIAHRDEAETVRSQVAQFLLDRDDRLAWAWFPPIEANPEGHGVAVAAAPALTAIWPGAGDRLRAEIDDFEDDHRADTPGRDGDTPRTGWRDRHAEYRYDRHNGLVVTARDVSVRRWPFGSEHYATTMSSAVDDLLAGGYDCFYPPQQSCTRVQSNGSFDVTLRGDQIVSVRFGIGSLIESGRQQHPLGEEFPNGLTFLTETVRRPVTERIERSRRTGTGFAGIVAGTVVIIDARSRVRGEGDLVAYFHIRIGVPLAATLPL